jgi:hypothetical protein
MMACGIALRAGTFGYSGATTQRAFNAFASGHLGAYSDIASLYIYHQMWHHWLPYWHYALEYPVGMGMFIWLTGLVGGGVGGYLAVNAVVLVLCGLATLWLLRRLPGTNPWLLALAPALALYVVLNWDLLAITALMLALVLFHRRRDGWGGAALAVATWTKLFPVLALPIILWTRLVDVQGGSGRDRMKTALRMLVPFALVTVVVNAPVMIARPHRWSYFFRFNDIRRGGGSLWALFDNGHISVTTANVGSFAALAAGLVLIFGAVAWAHRRHQVPTDTLIGPAMLACFGWLFFTIKLYSPQYDLWVMVLVALAAAPVALAVAFAAADLAFFAMAFTQFRLSNRWIEVHLTRPTIALREAALLALVAWAVWKIVGPELRGRERLPAVEPEGVPAPPSAATLVG